MLTEDGGDGPLDVDRYFVVSRLDERALGGGVDGDVELGGEQLLKQSDRGGHVEVGDAAERVLLCYKKRPKRKGPKPPPPKKEWK